MVAAEKNMRGIARVAALVKSPHLDRLLTVLSDVTPRLPDQRPALPNPLRTMRQSLDGCLQSHGRDNIHLL